MTDEDLKTVVARLDERTKLIHSGVNEIKQDMRADITSIQNDIRSLNKFRYYIHGAWAVIVGLVGLR